MVVVAAVDQSDRGQRVVAEGSRLAAAFDEPLEVLHVSSKSAYDVSDADTFSVRDDDVDKREIRREARTVATRAVEAAGCEAKAVGRIGDPPSGIVDYAEEVNARYLVVAARKRSPVGKAVFGSVAQSVILDAPCPVVTVVDRDG